MNIIQTLAKEFSLKEEQVQKTVELIDEGNTIPFIARYRKEVTGSLDDTVLRDLDDRLTYLRNIEKRKEEVKSLIAAQDKLTDEISAAIDNAKTITEVDDIYRPFRPHRKTRATPPSRRRQRHISTKSLVWVAPTRHLPVLRISLPRACPTMQSFARRYAP